MGNDFKFGRTFNKWIHVNLDFASLYGEQMGRFSGEIFSLSGLPPSAQGKTFRLNSTLSHRVEDHNLTERDIILLTRRDMSRGRGALPPSMITMADFSLSFQQFARASFVFFMDDDGSIKVLKNRYGTTN